MKWIAALVAVALSIGAPMAAPGVAAADAADPQGILFVGSSIFHRWTNLQAQMAPLPISNIAFDGAQTDDMLRIVDAYVLPKPAEGRRVLLREQRRERRRTGRGHRRPHSPVRRSRHDRATR